MPALPRDGLPGPQGREKGQLLLEEVLIIGEAIAEQSKGQQGMNPIDQLVILKLYRQLKELLKTVEGLEDAA